MYIQSSPPREDLAFLSSDCGAVPASGTKKEIFPEMKYFKLHRTRLWGKVKRLAGDKQCLPGLQLYLLEWSFVLLGECVRCTKLA